MNGRTRTRHIHITARAPGLSREASPPLGEGGSCASDPVLELVLDETDMARKMASTSVRT